MTTLTRPKCFDTQEAFDKWVQSAADAGNQVAPCADCSAPYEAQMRKAKRCDKKTVRREFKFIPISRAKVIEIKLEALPA